MESEAAAEKGSTVGKERAKKAVKVGAAVAGTALAAYGTYKVTQYVKEKAGQRALDIGHAEAKDTLNYFGSMSLSLAMTGNTDGASTMLNFGNERADMQIARGQRTAARVSNSTKQAAKYLYKTRNALKQYK